MKYAGQRLQAKRIARAVKKATAPGALATAEKRRKRAKTFWYLKRVPENMTAEEYLMAVVDAGVDMLLKEAERKRRKRKK